MGANTKYGRTRNRRAQALNSIINGQAPTLYPYIANLSAPGVITVGIWDETLNPYETMAKAPDMGLRIILLNGTGSHPQTVPFTVAGKDLTFSPTPAPIVGDNILILSWNEAIRGQNGEWIVGALLDVVL